MVYSLGISHTQRFNTLNKQNNIWLSMERVGSIANSAGNNLSPYRQMGSWDVGAADWRPSSFRQQLFLDNNYVIYIRKRAIINTLRNFVKMFYKKKKWFPWRRPTRWLWKQFSQVLLRGDWPERNEKSLIDHRHWERWLMLAAFSLYMRLSGILERSARKFPSSSLWCQTLNGFGSTDLRECYLDIISSAH